MARSRRARRKLRLSRAIATAMVLANLGCAATARYLSPDSGYVASGADFEPYDETRSSCLGESEFRSADGTPFTHWEEYQRCMAKAGWVRE